MIWNRWGHSLALTKEKEVFVWGWGAEGALGLGNTEPKSTPTLLATLKGRPIRDIVAGSDHSICIAEDGTVYAFGRY